MKSILTISSLCIMILIALIGCDNVSNKNILNNDDINSNAKKLYPRYENIINEKNDHDYFMETYIAKFDLGSGNTFNDNSIDDFFKLSDSIMEDMGIIVLKEEEYLLMKQNAISAAFNIDNDKYEMVTTEQLYKYAKSMNLSTEVKFLIDEYYSAVTEYGQNLKDKPQVANEEYKKRILELQNIGYSSEFDQLLAENLIGTALSSLELSSIYTDFIGGDTAPMLDQAGAFDTIGGVITGAVGGLIGGGIGGYLGGVLSGWTVAGGTAGGSLIGGGAAGVWPGGKWLSAINVAAQKWANEHM